MNRIGIFTAILFLSGSILFAEVKVGYIDSQRIFEDYKGIADLKQQFDKQQREWQQEAQRLKKEYEDLISELERQKLMLSDEARKKKEEKILGKKQEYEDYVRKIWGVDGDASKANIELTKPIIDRINKLLEKVGEEEKYTIIFDIAEGGIVYAKQGMDMTDRVIEELNREFEPVTVGEQKIVIFKFKELTKEAEEFEIANILFNLIYRIVDKTEKFKAIEKDRVDLTLRQKGLEREKEIPVDRGCEIGKLLNARIILLGEVSKNTEITVKTRLIDVETKKILVEEIARSETTKEQDLQTMVNDLVGRITSKYKP